MTYCVFDIVVGSSAVSTVVTPIPRNNLFIGPNQEESVVEDPEQEQEEDKGPNREQDSEKEQDGDNN